MSAAWLIATDMDGTLLGHDNYDWEPVQNCLAQLKKLSIPVVLNTSKTFAEVKEWVQRLALPYPFIIENGSAIYCPINYFPDRLLREAGERFTVQSGFQVISLGIELARLRAFVGQVKPRATSLADCSLETAVKITGLSAEEAHQAQCREFSLPLQFEDSSEQDVFAEQAQAAGFGVLQGGRFLHLMGNCDKGQSVQRLMALYQLAEGQPRRLLALGDSGNDRAMLNIADRAVVVRNNEGGWLRVDHPAPINTKHQAPLGWIEGVTQVLAQEFKELRSLHG